MIAASGTVQPTTSQDTNFAWGAAAEYDKDAVEDELATIDLRDPYLNLTKRFVAVVAKMDDEVATIDSFVAKAIYKITIQLIVRGIHGANLHLRFTLKIDSFVDETISDKKHSMDFFFDSGLNQTL